MIAPVAALKAYYSKVKEDLRLIKREQSMVNPDKLVMRMAFDLCFGDDSEETALSKFADKNIEYVSFYTAPKFVLPNERTFPAKLLSPKDQILYAQDKKTIQSSISRLKEEKAKGVYESALDIQICDEIISSLEQSLLSTSVKAAYLGGLLQAWNAVSDAHNALNMEGYILVATGKGDLMIDFWKAVNDLTDYSSLFPDRPPPGQKKSREDKESSPVWAPALGR